MPGKGSEPIAEKHSIFSIASMGLKDDIYYKGNIEIITSRMRIADIDLALKIKWAKCGFVSVPGNLGPKEEDNGE